MAKVVSLGLHINCVESWVGRTLSGQSVRSIQISENLYGQKSTRRRGFEMTEKESTQFMDNVFRTFTGFRQSQKLLHKFLKFFIQRSSQKFLLEILAFITAETPAERKKNRAGISRFRNFFRDPLGKSLRDFYRNLSGIFREPSKSLSGILPGISLKLPSKYPPKIHILEKVNQGLLKIFWECNRNSSN